MGEGDFARVENGLIQRAMRESGMSTSADDILERVIFSETITGETADYFLSLEFGADDKKRQNQLARPKRGS